MKKKEKSNEKENKNDEHKVIGKTERKKKKKNGNKTPLREIHINNKSFKFKFSRALNLKVNKVDLTEINEMGMVRRYEGQIEFELNKNNDKYYYNETNTELIAGPEV